MYEMRLKTNDRSYDIYIQNNEINKIPHNIVSKYDINKWLIITDENVSDLYLKTFEALLIKENVEVEHFIISPGETSKTLLEAEKIYDYLSENYYTRRDGIIALGGGVVGDLAGFVASTYLRGVPWVQVPTTLLAQVDSSVGGKVAVNTKYGKNLIGSFYQPFSVFIDAAFLLTLNNREIKSGLGEIIKYACIYDDILFDKLENSTIKNLDWFEIIKKCVETKKYFVEKDEKENGLRKQLNFGHTLGHGIEKYQNYLDLNHGEAIAIGMLFAAWLSYDLKMISLGNYNRIKKLLIQYGYHLHGKYDIDKLLPMILKDKKRVGNTIEFILLNKIGQSEIYALPNAILKEKLEEGLK